MIKLRDPEALLREAIRKTPGWENWLALTLRSPAADSGPQALAAGTHHLNCYNILPLKDGIDAEALFFAAARGLGGELTSALEPKFPARDIYLLGIDFHMHGFHPGLLFIRLWRQEPRLS